MKNYAFLIIILSLFTLNVSAQSPLEVFSEENYEGSSQQYEIHTLHIDLGSLDNNIKSFKLQQGYMVTFASNSDGTGYSRVYRADDADLEISVMPPYLNNTVSFIRTLPLNTFVKRKGWAGWNVDEINAFNVSWYYDWSAGGSSSPTIEYVPIKQKKDWPSWDEINTKQGATDLLGYNEPTHDDQANMTVQECIDGWPNHMQSGLRIGSIATDDPFNNFLQQFMDKAEELNYRVDFIPLHCYWNKTASQWSSDLDYVYNTYKRPIWITEWNIGANWTDSWFEDDSEMLTDRNATKHYNDMIAILDILESKEYIERYSVYNWVENARKMVADINDEFKELNPDWESYEWLKTAPVIATATDGTGDYKVLTPAGEYYRDLDSKKAYNPAMEFIPTWTPFTESLSYTVSDDFQNIKLSWQGINNDLVNKYVIERKLEGETEFSAFYESSDYAVLNVDDVIHSYAEYRIKVIGKDDAESTYSEILIFQQSEVANAPTDLTGEALASSVIYLNWSAVNNATGYNLKRATNIDGSYETIASNITDLNYQDTSLNADTNYYYKISSVNSGGEGEDSVAITVKTLTLEMPNVVSNIMVSSGDAQIILVWDLMYDAQFYIKRSTSENGTFETIATVDSFEYTDAPVVNGITYYYKVSAFNAMGESEDSNIIIAKPEKGQHTYYSFNENEGSNTHDQWGNYSVVLTSIGWAPGFQDSSIYLDGTASSYMDIEDGVMEDLTDFTISAWLKLESVQNWARLFDFGKNTETYMFLSPKSTGTGNFRFAFNNGGTEEAVDTNYRAVLGEWMHVAITLEGSVAIMYINGVEVGRNETMTINPSMLGKTTQNYIGKSQWPDPQLNGRIDEFKIFNYALSSAEISEITDDISISNNNFTIEAYGETCPDKDNGQIVITGSSDLTYNALVNGTSYTFTDNTLILTDLPIGTYDVCITVAEVNFEQCYMIDIPENEILYGKFNTSKGKVHVELATGTAPYNVAINGVIQFQTYQTKFDVYASSKDLVEITSAKACEGLLTYGSSSLLNAVAYPNPTSGLFDITIQTDSKEINLEIYDMMSRLIFKSNYPIIDGKVSVNIENEPSGIYFVKVQSDTVKTFRIIKK